MHFNCQLLLVFIHTFIFVALIHIEMYKSVEFPIVVMLKASLHVALRVLHNSFDKSVSSP